MFECVPNVSEGRDPLVLSKIRQVISDSAGIRLLNFDSSFDANRTVITFVGDELSIATAVSSLVAMCLELIDMRNQKGSHPRIGALDVCPIIPLNDSTMEQAVDLSLKIGREVSSRLSIPIFLYAESANSSYRRDLSSIRKGEFEGLKDKLNQHHWVPDFGPRGPHPSFGAMALGARDILVAFNVNLETDDERVAKHIAQSIRTKASEISGAVDGTHRRLPALKAIGWTLPSEGRVQVSCNLVDYKKTGLAQVYEACRALASAYGTRVTGSEVVGMLPIEALLAAGNFYLVGKEATSEELVETAVRELNLSELSPFILVERLLPSRL